MRRRETLESAKLGDPEETGETTDYCLAEGLSRQSVAFSDGPGSNPSSATYKLDGLGPATASSGLTMTSSVRWSFQGLWRDLRHSPLKNYTNHCYQHWVLPVGSPGHTHQLTATPRSGCAYG